MTVSLRGLGRGRSAVGTRCAPRATGVRLDARGVRHTDESGTVDESRAPATWTPTAQLAALAGTYVSDEAETTLTAVVENHALVLKRRPHDDHADADLRRTPSPPTTGWAP